jgi:hypothetical protein
MFPPRCASGETDPELDLSRACKVLELKNTVISALKTGMSMAWNSLKGWLPGGFQVKKSLSDMILDLWIGGWWGTSGGIFA